MALPRTIPPPRPVTLLRLAGLLLTSAALAGCGEETTGPGASGESSFQVDITGDLNTRVTDSGACYSQDPRDQPGVVLFNGPSLPDTIWLLTFFRPFGETIPDGTRPLGVGEWSAALSRVDGDTFIGTGIWTPTSGSVTITEVAPDRVTGTFTFAATQDSILGQPRSSPNIQVMGSFDARQPVNRFDSSCR